MPEKVEEVIATEPKKKKTYIKNVRSKTRFSDRLVNRMNV
jgi:hypothetical protein